MKCCELCNYGQPRGAWWEELNGIRVISLSRSAPPPFSQPQQATMATSGGQKTQCMYSLILGALTGLTMHCNVSVGY